MKTNSTSDEALVELSGTKGTIWVPKAEMTDGSRCASCKLVLNESAMNQPGKSYCYICKIT